MPVQILGANLETLSHPAYWVPGLLLAAAALWDLRFREIPHTICLALVAWAVVARITGFQPPDWIEPLVGLLVGLGVGILLYLPGWWGAGDAKLLAGLGAPIGALALLHTLPLILLWGAGFSLLARFRRARSADREEEGRPSAPAGPGGPSSAAESPAFGSAEDREIPYAPAIALGYATAMVLF